MLRCAWSSISEGVLVDRSDVVDPPRVVQASSFHLILCQLRWRWNARRKSGRSVVLELHSNVTVSLCFVLFYDVVL